MSFVNDNNNIITLRQNRVFLALVVSELVNQRKQNGLVGFQFFTQLLAIRRLYLILIGNKLCTQEVLINLRIGSSRSVTIRKVKLPVHLCLIFRASITME